MGPGQPEAAHRFPWRVSPSNHHLYPRSLSGWRVSVSDDRRVVPQWKPTAAELAAIHGHAPQVLGDINNSDFDFCDTEVGVLGVFAGIANQQSNP